MKRRSPGKSGQAAALPSEGRSLAQRLRLDKLPSRIIGLSPAIGIAITRAWYRYMTHLDREHEMTFMNYGYAEIDREVSSLTLTPEDEVNRYCIQLYQHLSTGVDLQGRSVLEVGSGRGGGASYVARYLKPASLTGIDIAAAAVGFCKDHYDCPGLTFAHGDAEAIPFARSSFDVVFNVESSHYYRSVPRFLAEVRRVLKPDGWFMFADFRRQEEMPALRRQLVEAGFEVVRETNITANILQALNVDNERKLSLIHSKVPWLFRKAFKEFAAVPGSASYESFSRGRWEYLSFALKRGPSDPSSPTQSHT